MLNKVTFSGKDNNQYVSQGLKVVGLAATGACTGLAYSALSKDKFNKEKENIITNHFNEIEEDVQDYVAYRNKQLNPLSNDEIADLFTTLLANASNIDMVNTAHPAFISIIERLSPDEARIIKYLKGKEDIQYCDFRGNVKNGNGYNTIIEHATLIPQEVHLAFPKNVNAYLANFVSLGILFDMVGTYRIDQTIYNKIKEFYGFEKLKTQLAPNVFKEVVANNSYYKVTDFGKLFIQACIK